MVNNVLLNEILSTLKEEKKYHTLRDVLAAMKPVDLAELLGEVPESQVPILFRLLRKERAAEVFVEMDTDSQERLIRQLSDTELKAVVDELAADDAADLVEDMPAPVVNRILRQADPMTRQIYESLLRRIMPDRKPQSGKESYAGGQKVLSEFVIMSGSVLEDRTVMEITWPNNCLLVALEREGREMIPRGKTKLQAGDKLTVMTDELDAGYIHDKMENLCYTSF